MIIKEKKNVKKSNFRKPKFFKVILLLFILVAGIIGCNVLSGILKKKEYNGIGDFISTVWSNYWNARNVKVENVSIEIKGKDLKKLEKNRENALGRGVIINDLDGAYFPATLTYNDKKIKIKLRLKGHMIDHLQNDKWSFRIKVKDENTFMGMKRFSFQHPGTRGYIYEWIYHEMMRREGIIALRYKFINVTVNGKDWGIYAVEENFDEELIANNNRVRGPIIRFNPDLYWVDRLNELKGPRPTAEFTTYYAANVEAYREDKVLEDSTQRKYYLKAIACMDALRSKKCSVDQVFDIERLAKFHAIIDLVGGKESIDWSDIKYYFNPVSNRLEPVAYESFTNFPAVKLSGMYKYEQPDSSTYHKDWHSALFSNPVFFRAYVKALERISSKAYLDKFFEEEKNELSQNLGILNKEFPYKKFDNSYYYFDQEMIVKMMNATKAFHAYYKKAEGNRLYLQIGAIESLPMEIKSVQSGKLVWKPAAPLILPSKQMNAYVDYKEYVFEGPPISDSLAGSLMVNYSLLGASTEKQVNVFPYPHPDVSAIVEEHAKTNTINNFSFLKVDEVNKIIRIEMGKHEILSDLVIPSGYKVIAFSGTILDLKNNAKILSYSPAFFEGDEDEPIVITSTDFTGQGVKFIDAPGSKFKSVLIKNMAASLVFNESKVAFTGCDFLNIKREAALQMIHSEYEINGCSFQNLGSIGIQALFSRGTVWASGFQNCAEAGIETSMGTIRLDDVKMNNVNKGLNFKAGSQVKGKGISISQASVALTAKNGSMVELSNAIIENSGTGIASINKKGQAPALTQIAGLQAKGVKRNYQVENGSRIIVNGTEVRDDGKTQNE